MAGSMDSSGEDTQSVSQGSLNRLGASSTYSFRRESSLHSHWLQLPPVEHGRSDKTPKQVMSDLKRQLRMHEKEKLENRKQSRKKSRLGKFDAYPPTGRTVQIKCRKTGKVMEHTTRLSKQGSKESEPISWLVDEPEAEDVPEKKLTLPQLSSLPHCFDVGRQRAWWTAIHHRVKQSHMEEAFWVCEDIKKEEDKLEKEDLKERGEAEEEVGRTLYEPPSEVFDDPTYDRTKAWKPQSLIVDATATPAMDRSIAARKMGLAKMDEFTGTEATSLKKLLRSLNTKKWDKELYFYIRFFSLRNKLHAIPPERKVLVKQRWALILRMLSTMAKISRVLADISYEKSKECVSIVDIVESSLRKPRKGLGFADMFEKDQFKPSKMLLPMLSIDAQEILRDKLPEEREPEDIEQAILSLQYVDDFAKLPVNVQRCFVEEGSYWCVRSNRVIVRQGHVAQFYYLVLQGQAIAKRFLPNKKTETTAIIKKGKGFGSAAIFNKCPRLVTVVSQSYLHLLAVPRKAFEDMYMHRMMTPQAEAADFFSKMWFMKKWPISYIIKCPSECQIRQFRRREIIEKSAALSDWIYVVRAGTCQLFQKVAIKPTDASKFVLPPTAPTYSKKESHAGPSHKMSHTQSHHCMPKPKTTQSGGHLYHVPQSSTASNSFPKLPPVDKKQKQYTYKWLQTLRYLDVFGLEDLKLDPKQPPPHRKKLMLISDGVECAMLSKKFYLTMAGPEVRKSVHERLSRHKPVYAQLTSELCSLIGKAGVRKDPDMLLDPLDFCVHI